jgi:predicted glycosyltransferase
MRIWIDLANSPHVPLFGPVVARLRADGHSVLLTARDHAQTRQLAEQRWGDLVVIGGPSPPGRVAKASTLAGRVFALHRYAHHARPDVAFSHGSYAQIVAARTARVPVVTMMDYEHQPANHLSFRLATSVIVPELFPGSALRRFGASPRKVVRYPGFKEDLYLASFRPDPSVLEQLGLNGERVLAVFRPPPEGALYHPGSNDRFDEVLREALARDDVEPVLLARTDTQAQLYAALSPPLWIPKRAVDGSSLLALADLAVGAGGTMNRESALLGTPTYTVFAGQLAAVDAELMRQGLLRDLRQPGSPVAFEKKNSAVRSNRVGDPDAILKVITTAIADASSRRDARRRRRPARRSS